MRIPQGDEAGGQQETALDLHELASAMDEVETAVGTHFPEVLDSLNACLAIATVGCFSDNAQPTTLILVAPAGAGKTMALNFMMPANKADPLADYFYRSDKFTAASFVSHRADLSPSRLKKVDLLPRLPGKTLITKELAPIFSGKRDELMDRFAMLTTVLDGQGLVSDSGAHGRRGYSGAINFQWLGATTPLSPEALAVMAQLGPRILCYNADRPRNDTETLMALARCGDVETAKGRCQAAVHELLERLYAQHPPASLPSTELTFDDDRLRVLALWAQALVALRATVRRGTVDAIEHPERVLGMLRNFALASALVHGRRAVNDYDLAQMTHIAMSSGVAGRQRVFRAVLALGGKGTTTDIEGATGLSTPTVSKYMKELGTVGLANFTEGQGSRPARVELREPYRELCGAPLLRQGGSRTGAAGRRVSAGG